MEKTKKKFPHIFAVLFLMMALALIATWLVPSGTYERAVLEGTTRPVVDPSSVTLIEKVFLSPFKLFTAVTEGMNGAALVAFSIIIIGGSWQIIHRTGAISNGISSIAKKVTIQEMAKRGTHLISTLSAFKTIMYDTEAGVPKDYIKKVESFALSHYKNLKEAIFAGVQIGRYRYIL